MAGRKPAGVSKPARSHPNARTVVLGVSIPDDVHKALNDFMAAQRLPLKRSTIVADAIRDWLKKHGG